MAKIRTVLISVADKSGIAEFAARLDALGVQIISTAGTARLLRERGLEVMEVSEYTGYPTILGGMVRTLHPKVLGGLLARRGDEQQTRELAEHGIRPIDMVVVNLYPFVNVILHGEAGATAVSENIDVGGPAMVRAAAKNYTHVAVVTDPSSYDAIATELERADACLGESTHFELAVQAFRHTAHYDTAIAEYMSGIEGQRRVAPDWLVIELVKKQDLCRGENPHQRAALYAEGRSAEPSVATAEQVGGPPLSFNDVLDADAGLALAKEFDRPAAVIVRHACPCGVACADSARAALEGARQADPAGAAGCLVVLNRPLDRATACAIAEAPAPVIDCLVAPEFDHEALEMLCKRVDWAAQTRLLKTGPLDCCLVDERARDERRLVGGVLVQDRDLLGFDPDGLDIVTQAAPSPGQMADLRLAWLCCKHVKSSAAVLARGEAAVGVGAGGADCLDAALAALRKAGEAAAGATMATDSPITAPECIEHAAEAGVTAIIQPGGARDDAALVAAADRLGLAMAFTGTQHLRH